MSKIIHVFWSQGWVNAPPKAVRNAKAWEDVGTVLRWDDESARKAGLLHERIGPDAAPALKCDIVLAAAQHEYGGLAVGADMAPLRVDRIKHELDVLNMKAMCAKGMVVYSTWGDQPYNGFSWFPQKHLWIGLVRKAHLKVAASDPGEPRDIGALTGPRLWRALIQENLRTWLMTVRTLNAARVFNHELKCNMRKWAWIDPGLQGDWHGTKPDVWQ